jgi:capsular exopolysaccharide synthesis family protein
MSNLIPRPGATPTLGPPSARGDTQQTLQTVQVADLSQGGSNGDEIDLRELWRALLRRKRLVLATAAGVLSLTLLITAYQRLFKPVYEGGFQLLITDPVSEGGGNDNGAAQQAVAGTAFEQLALNSTRSDLPTLMEVLESPLLLEPLARRHGLDFPALSNSIQIATGGSKQKEAEGVLKITLTGGDPKRDQRLLNDLARTYLNYSLSQRQQRLGDGLKFLDRQAPSLQTKATELQAELARFRERNNLLEPNAEGAALKTQIAELDQQLRELQAERSRLQAARRGILNGSLSARGFEEAIGSGSSSRTAASGQGLSVAGSGQSLLEQLAKLDDQIADARSRYNASSPMVRGLLARRSSLLPLLRRNQLEAIDAALGLNGNRLAVAKAQQNLLDARFLRQPGLIKQYEDLQQRLKITQDNLAGLIQARENFQLEIAQRTVPWTVIAQPRIDPDPVKPSLPRNLALGLVLGLVAGAGAGLLRDRLDHVFHSPSEVTDDLRQPLLGHIPHVPFFKGVREDRRFLIEELDGRNTSEASEGLSGYQRFFYQEAFRNLFTSLRFLNSGTPLRSVALTSSLPAEGKSLVNVLLAKTLSEMGQRVLLVDADLRKPQLHYRLGVNNLLGLSNLLTESDLHWQEVIQPVAGHESWSVLTAGRVPPDPARLLSSSRMHGLVRELAASDRFDLILYDTPPVLGLADAALVAEHLDGLLLLVSLDRVDRGLPKEAVARIRSSGAALLGIVTNAVKEQRSGRGSAYGYGYGYGNYGYSYGGYGAYDPRSTYSYYQQDEGTQTTLPADASSTTQPWLAQLNTWRQRLIRWIDS